MARKRTNRRYCTSANGMRGLRRLKGLTSEALAEQADVQGGQIRRFEVQGKGIADDALDRIAGVLGVKRWNLYDPTLPSRMAQEQGREDWRMFVPENCESLVTEG